VGALLGIASLTRKQETSTVLIKIQEICHVGSNIKTTPSEASRFSTGFLSTKKVALIGVVESRRGEAVSESLNR
jgi:hypothetical protein